MNKEKLEELLLLLALFEEVYGEKDLATRNNVEAIKSSRKLVNSVILRGVHT